MRCSVRCGQPFVFISWWPFLKKEGHLNQSLYEILQILSLHPFEQSPIPELFAKNTTEIQTHENQKSFDFNTL